VQLVSLKMATVSESAEVADVPPEGGDDNGRFNDFAETICIRRLEMCVVLGDPLL